MRFTAVSVIKPGGQLGCVERLWRDGGSLPWWCGKFMEGRCPTMPPVATGMLLCFLTFMGEWYQGTVDQALAVRLILP